MPRVPTERKIERRRQILDAAWRRVAASGFRDMTVDAVCAEAGLSKGAFYLYFEQKRDLLVALFEDDAQQIDTLMTDLEREVADGRDRLRRYMRAVLNRSSEPGRVQVGADIWTAMLTEHEVRTVLAARMQLRRARLRKWIEEAVESRELVDVPANAFASILLALTDGLLVHGSLDPHAFRWTNIGRALDVLLGGIST